MSVQENELDPQQVARLRQELIENGEEKAQAFAGTEHAAELKQAQAELEHDRQARMDAWNKQNQKEMQREEEARDEEVEQDRQAGVDAGRETEDDREHEAETVEQPQTDRDRAYEAFTQAEERDRERDDVGLSR